MIIAAATEGKGQESQLFTTCYKNSRKNMFTHGDIAPSHAHYLWSTSEQLSCSLEFPKPTTWTPTRRKHARVSGTTLQTHNTRPCPVCQRQATLISTRQLEMVFAARPQLSFLSHWIWNERGKEMVFHTMPLRPELELLK